MRFFCLLILFHFVSGLLGQKQTPQCLFDLLYAQDSISITLIYPFDSLYTTQKEEIEAIIHIATSQGMIMEDEPIKLNLRGKFRRMNCTMPPLMLNFRKSTLKDLGLNKHDEIKLVTHCLESEEGQENLLEERLCYQLYESLTTYSYRTIWLNILYQDAGNPSNGYYSSAFLLEPDKDLEDRLGIEETKMFNPAEDSLDFDTYSKVVAFNFMIGNRDWSVMMARNAKLFYDAMQHKYIVIPYDFDYSNIVGASYRRSVKAEHIQHPNDRLYQGEYFSKLAADILTLFEKTETGILHKIMVLPGELSEKHRKKIRTYCETWYKYIKTRKAKDLQYGMVMPYKGGL